MTLRSLAVTVALLAACSGSSHSDASGSGTIGGVSFNANAGFGSAPSGAGFVCASGADGGADCASTGQEELTVTITNNAAFACGDDLSNFANLETLTVSVNESGSIGPGHYGISTSVNGASATFVTTTSSCGSGVVSAATGGSVTLTSVTGDHIAGSVSLMFGSSPFTGSFDVPSCASTDGGPPADAGLPMSVTSCTP